MARSKSKRRVQKSQNLSVIGESTALKEFESKMESIDLLSQLYSTSMPRNLSFSSIHQQSFSNVTRDAEYYNRREIYKDAFTRECVKVIIARAIGTTHDSIKPFQINLKSDIEINDKLRETIETDLNHVIDVIDKTLLEVSMDAQFFGDGYTRILAEQGKGIEKILLDTSTKAFNITPFVTNKHNTVAYEVSPNMELMGTKKKNEFGVDRDGRKYVSPMVVARMSALSNGIRDLTTESLIAVERMNAFEEVETPYEDIIYGGVIEGVKESFSNYVWAINALADLRIMSNRRERFITHTLNGVGDQERKLLKGMLETQIKSAIEQAKQRVVDKDTKTLDINHIIPTTGENATNSISIQESTPELSGLANIEDVKFHILRYMADLGFDINLTPYADTKMGGLEKDSPTQTSIQMEIQGEQIRKSMIPYIQHILRVHFLSKYNLEIDLGMLEITFTSTINQAKILAEAQRMEGLSNMQQFSAVIESFKAFNLDDTPANREFLRLMIIDVLPQTINDRASQADTIVEVILKGVPKEEGEEL